MTDNAPALVEELDLRKQAQQPGDVASEMAIWEAATRLGHWFLVNRGSEESPSLQVFQPPELGTLIAIYSSLARAAEGKGDTEGTVIGVPVATALDWLASYGERGASGIVLDQPGPWIPLANLSYLKRWLPEGPA